MIIDRSYRENMVNKLNTFSNKKPVFIIAMPGSLHILDLCLSFLPKQANIILILNGLCRWEETWVSHNLNCEWIIRTNWVLDHPTIINKLFENIDYPFGIMDYDCFLINSDAYQQFVSVIHESLGNALFYQKLDHLKIFLPHTHALFFNTVRVKSIFKNYDIDARRIEYDQLPKKSQTVLQKIGVNTACLPEEDFNFDTLKVMILLGIANKIEFNRISNPDQPIALHIGCITNPENHSNRWSQRASYFWQLVLHNHKDKKLKCFYLDKYLNLPDLSKLKKSLENDEFTSPDFFNKVERILMGPSV